MGLRVKYYWRELTEDGLLKPFKVYPWHDRFFGNFGYDTEEDALNAFKDAFCENDKNFYMSAQHVLVKCYGVE